ncbi:hypothetical protein BpHYR1_013476 [Brachionus plicatilis]|uniref:Uncharacterized protein n=1 Tax=Brachionus plicatilis TaxID=10195 RepID=A0A3M7SDB3_BRAPC|nr:hypothetical protein BpHYR1_013476 [Brachionus plicatilis]
MKLKIVSEESDSDDPPVQEPLSKKIRLVETLTVTLQPQITNIRVTCPESIEANPFSSTCISG